MSANLPIVSSLSLNNACVFIVILFPPIIVLTYISPTRHISQIPQPRPPAAMTPTWVFTPIDATIVCQSSPRPCCLPLALALLFVPFLAVLNPHAKDDLAMLQLNGIAANSSMGSSRTPPAPPPAPTTPTTTSHHKGLVLFMVGRLQDRHLGHGLAQQ